MTISNVFCACRNIKESDKFLIAIYGGCCFDFYDYNTFFEIPLEFKDAIVTSFTIDDEPGKHLFIVENRA